MRILNQEMSCTNLNIKFSMKKSDVYALQAILQDRVEGL